MSQLNPLLGPILQASGMQTQQAGEKSRQIRRTQTLKKNAAADTKEPTDILDLETPVENPDEVGPPQDRDPTRRQPQQRKEHHQEATEDEPKTGGLDLTA